MRLASVLSHEELIPMALERWQKSIEEPVEYENQEEDRIEFIGEIVEAFFELLPSVRSMRWEYVLSLEDAERRTQSAQPAEVEKEETQFDVEQLITNNLEAAQRIEHELKEREAAAGRRTELHSPIFRKERERLEELKRSISEDKLVADAS